MSAEELDALPDGAFVRDDRGRAWKHVGRNWMAGLTGMNSQALSRRGPHTILEVAR